MAVNWKYQLGAWAAAGAAFVAWQYATTKTEVQKIRIDVLDNEESKQSEKK